MLHSLPPSMKRLAIAYGCGDLDESCRVSIIVGLAPSELEDRLLYCTVLYCTALHICRLCAPAFLSPAWGYVCAWARTPPSPSIISIIILPLLLLSHHHHLQSCCHSDAARNTPPEFLYRLLALDEVDSSVEVVAAIVDPLLFPAQPSSSEGNTLPGR